MRAMADKTYYRYIDTDGAAHYVDAASEVPAHHKGAVHELTIHAGTALGALRRLEQLIQEAVITVPKALIAETIDVVAVLRGRGAERRLAELANVAGLDPATGDYRILSVVAGGDLLRPGEPS